jgi:hypothetical protein
MENAVAYGKEYSGVQLMQSSAETIDAADNTYDVVTTGPAPGSEVSGASAPFGLSLDRAPKI